jgi:hypothetical protein
METHYPRPKFHAKIQSRIHFIVSNTIKARYVSLVLEMNILSKVLLFTFAFETMASPAIRIFRREPEPIRRRH